MRTSYGPPHLLSPLPPCRSASMPPCIRPFPHAHSHRHRGSQFPSPPAVVMAHAFLVAISQAIIPPSPTTSFLLRPTLIHVHRRPSVVFAARPPFRTSPVWPTGETCRSPSDLYDFWTYIHNKTPHCHTSPRIGTSAPSFPRIPCERTVHQGLHTRDCTTVFNLLQ